MKTIFYAVLFASLVAISIPDALAAGGGIAGKITGEKTGEAVAGIAVTASCRAQRFQARSSADGTYTFENLPPGRYSVRLSQPYDKRSKPRRHSGLSVIEGSVASPVDFVLCESKRYRIEGVVRDAGNNPVEGAQIKMKSSFPREKGQPEHDYPFEILAVTDSAGKFKMEVEGREQDATLIVTKDGYATGESEAIKLAEDGKTYKADITLGAGVSITGYVKDEAGKPVKGASVRLSQIGFGGKSKEASTDAGGRFEFDNVKEGKVSIRVEQDGYARTRKTVEVKPGDREPVQITLGSGAALSGRILDQDGNALEKARVSVSCREYKYNRTVTTKVGGKFAFEDAPRGKCSLKVQKEGYCVERREDISPGTEGLEIKLEKGKSIKGAVVDGESGKPVEQFEVRLNEFVPASDKYRYVSSSKFRNKEGRFELEGIHPERRYELVVKADNHAAVHLADVTLGGSAKTIAVKLEKGGEIKGKVIDKASGKAIDKVMVVIFKPEQQADDGFESWESAVSGDFASTGDSFSCKNIPAGKWKAVAMKKGYKQVATPTVEISPQSWTASVTIEMVKGKEGEEKDDDAFYDN